MDVDIPEVVAEMRANFMRYETALMTNDVEALQSIFRKDPRTLRYGPAENLLGWDMIAAFRANRNPAGIARTLENTVITTFGRDFAVANTEFLRGGKRGRQSQTWVRFPDTGWHVVAAHVSMMAE